MASFSSDSKVDARGGGFWGEVEQLIIDSTVYKITAIDIILFFIYYFLV
jgi:hypothetical protein